MCLRRRSFPLDTVTFSLHLLLHLLTRKNINFLSQNIFRDGKKVFCDLFVGMELENGKTETRYHLGLGCTWLPFKCSKINKYQDHFLSAFYAI